MLIHAKTALKGFVIGIANIIPGVSGGTLAVILNIYERMIKAISDFSFYSLKTIIFLFSFKRKNYVAFRKEIKRVDGLFLGLVLIGMALAFIAFSSVMTYLIETYHDITYGFFFGLILASVSVPFSKIKQINIKTIIGLIVGIAIVVFFALMESDADKIKNAQMGQEAAITAQSLYGLTADRLIMVFVTGVLATSAMILPGISGSFISLLLGQYFFLLYAISTMNILVLAVYLLGSIIGVKIFAKIMKFLFEKIHNVLMAFLTGLIVGSLYVTWPFKASAVVGDELVYLSNILPKTFGVNEALTLATILLGISVVIFMLFLSKKVKKKESL